MIDHLVKSICGQGPVGVTVIPNRMFLRFAFCAGFGSVMSIAVLIYSAIGPGAVADVMQSVAQTKVSASEANVILSSEPLWACEYCFG